MGGRASNIQKRSSAFSYVLKCVKTSRHDKERLFIISYGLPYIISKLTMWAITTLKDFRIASYLRKIGMPKLLTLAMNHPVCFGLSTSNWNEGERNELSEKS